MNKLRHIVLTVAVGLMALPLAAQNSNAVSEPAKFKPRFSVGFDFTPEWCLSPKGSIDDYDPGHRFYPTFGINFQAQLSRRDGIEAGIYYRSFEQTVKRIIHPNPGTPPNTVFPEYRNKYTGKYLSLRLMYRFYSKIIDVSAGFTADIVVGAAGYREIPIGSADYSYEYWGNVNQKNLYGFIFRVSKDIPLYKGLILQPEIHVNPCIGDDGSGLHKTTYRGTFLGCGVGLKYRF